MGFSLPAFRRLRFYYSRLQYIKHNFGCVYGTHWVFKENNIPQRLERFVLMLIIEQKHNIRVLTFKYILLPYNNVHTPSRIEKRYK